MTPAEESALAEVKGILSLHFDAFVLSTRTADEDGADRINTDWHGALSDVMGIQRISSLRMDEIAKQRSIL